MTPAAVGLRCPDHSGKPQGVQKVQRAVTGVGSRRPNFVTLGLIAINVAVAFAEKGSFISSSIFQHGALFARACCINGQYVGVAEGDWWRLITSMFLHAGWLHLAMNMYALYFVGTILEQIIGRWRFVLLYLASGLAGSAGALVWSPTTPTVGASGAIFGVLGALLVLERRGNISTGGQVLGLIVLNLVITFAFSSAISVGGHVGGLIGGVLLMLLLVNLRRSAAYSIAASVGVAAIAIVVAYMKVRNYQ